MPIYTRIWNGYRFAVDVEIGAGPLRHVVLHAKGCEPLSTGQIPEVHAEALVCELPSGCTCMKLISICAEPKYAGFGPPALRMMTAIARVTRCSMIWGEASTHESPWGAVKTFYRREGFCVDPGSHLFRKDLTPRADWDCI